jgi:hypothetical protein
MRNRKLLITLTWLAILFILELSQVSCQSQPNPRPESASLPQVADIPTVGVAKSPTNGSSTASLENGGRIFQGMKAAEVEALLGPPGDYRTSPTRSRGELRIIGAGLWSGSQAVIRTDKWITDTLEIQVLFGLSDEAVLVRAFELNTGK